jgi:putative oxidoreductase
MKILNRLHPGPAFSDIILLFVRLSVGASMITHGWPKMMKLMGDAPIAFPDPLQIGMTASLILTVFAEVICSVFIALGLWTRAFAIPLFITMLVAVLIVHSGDSFSDREGAIQYTLVYALLFVSGGGKYSLDRLFKMN